MANVIANLFRNRGSAITVGQAYLHYFPNERNLAVLLADLDQDSFGPAAAPEPTREARIRTLFKQRRRDDFAEGRTVILNGWVLSLTEARLCAAAALIWTARGVGSVSTS